MKTSSAEILKNPVYCLAFGFGSGLSPKAPGTLGTMVAVPFYFLFASLPIWAYALVVVIAFLLGIWVCSKTSDYLGAHDHGGIVFDEFVGYWITMFMVPISWNWALLGFLIFRLLDIFKPWPINYIDKRLKGGLGVMLDDAIAGGMSALCIHALIILTG